MDITDYADVDLYGRGFHGIFGNDAEERHLREAFAKLIAMGDVEWKIKSGLRLDPDLYGRGDPSVHGPNALKKFQEAAVEQPRQDGQIHLRKGRKLKLRAQRAKVVSKLKKFTEKTRTFARRVSLKRNQVSTNSGQVAPDNDIQDNNERVKRDRAHVVRTELSDAVEPTCVSSDSPEPNVRNDTTTHYAQEMPSAIGKIGLPTTFDTTRKLFKSQLPSQESRPRVEPGHVARLIESFNGFGQLSTEDSTSPRTESNNGEAERSFTPQLVSKAEETVKGTLSEEESSQKAETLVPQDDIADKGINGESIILKEDFLARTPSQEHPLVDAGLSAIGGSKIAGSFCSADHDSAQGHRKDASDSDAHTSWDSAEGTSRQERLLALMKSSLLTAILW